MKSYKEYMQERMEEFEATKGEELWFLRDSIKVLQHYAESTDHDGDAEAAKVFAKYLQRAQDTYEQKKDTYTTKTESLKNFFAERDINVSEWD